MTERSEVTDLNQPTKWFEITATPEQLEQGRHHWKITYQYIPATCFIQTAANTPKPSPNLHTLTQHLTTAQEEA